MFDWRHYLGITSVWLHAICAAAAMAEPPPPSSALVGVVAPDPQAADPVVAELRFIGFDVVLRFSQSEAATAAEITSLFASVRVIAVVVLQPNGAIAVWSAPPRPDLLGVVTPGSDPTVVSNARLWAVEVVRAHALHRPPRPPSATPHHSREEPQPPASLVSHRPRVHAGLGVRIGSLRLGPELVGVAGVEIPISRHLRLGVDCHIPITAMHYTNTAGSLTARSGAAAGTIQLHPPASWRWRPWIRSGIGVHVLHVTGTADPPQQGRSDTIAALLLRAAGGISVRLHRFHALSAALFAEITAPRQRIQLAEYLDFGPPVWGAVWQWEVTIP